MSPLNWLRALVARVMAWRAARRAGFVEHEYRTGTTTAGDRFNAGVGGESRH